MLYDSSHYIPLQVQGGQAGLTWLLLGIAAKLLAVADLSMQRTAAYSSLPASQVQSVCRPHIESYLLLLVAHQCL